MSELSRTIQYGTNQIADAMTGLAAARREKRARKSAAMREAGQALADLGTTIGKYGDMRRAREAEDDTKQVNEAYGLGMTTKGPQGALVALGAVRPRTAAGATLLSTYSERAQDLVRRQDNSRLLEAQAHHMEAMDQEAAKERERAEKGRADLRAIMSRERPPAEGVDPNDPDEQDLAQAREAVALGALDYSSYLKLRAQVTATRKARADDERRRTDLQTKVGLEREKIASKERIAAENAGLQRDRLDAMKSARENAAQVASETLAVRREFMSQAAAIAQNRALRESLRERLRAQVESINRIDKQIILQKAWAEEDGADALKQALDDAVLARDDILQQLDAAAELEIPQGVQAQAPSAPVAPPDLTPDEQAIFDSMSPEEQQAFVEELSR